MGSNMLRKTLCLLLLCSGATHAFDGARHYTANRKGVRHTLAIEHWKVDAKGAPTFDYVYEQHKGTCTFRLAGHAIGLTEVVHGKVALVEYPRQDSKGRDLSSIATFDGGPVALSIPADGTYSDAGVVIRYTPEQRTRACDKGNEDGLWVSLYK